MADPLLVGIMLGGTFLEQLAGEEESLYRLKDARENERLANEAAADAIARGNLAVARLRTQASQLIARQRVAYGASGVDASTGTPASVMGGTRALSELDAQMLKNNAATEAWGFKRYGLKYREQAAYEHTRAGYRQAGTFLTGAGRLLSMSGSRGGGDSRSALDRAWDEG